ncbi:M24 family metallopeptidase [Nesterenkonia rhizosphaerae]|uniref:M24 family metallopeptidase n=1 Tax=Nesterenkonia rhizosphaerae TaxID=1348272 RepID=A0ABP9FS78_9MICC
MSQLNETITTRTEEFTAKHARLVKLLEQTGDDAVVLSSAGALSWLLCGARVHVSLAGPPILRAVAHRDGVELAVFNNEAERIRAEELRELTDAPGLQIHELAWHANIDDVASWLPDSLRTVAEGSLADEGSAALPLREARASLLETEVQRYRALCQDAAGALTEVLSEVTPSTTERQLAAALAPWLISAGADPVVLLVNGESRARHRHPLPTDAALGRRAMAVVCARRDGLIANVTRWVRFGEASPEELEQEQAILEVEADVFDALTPGTALDTVLEVLKESYPRHGFSQAEWTLHHQGGAAGYQGRDPRVSPGVPDLIHSGQPFAWNPSAFSPQLGLGFKVEDTVLLRGAADLEILSTDERWPTTEVRGRRRPLPLTR